jgi:uncharacterized protein YdeI (YjbR/CyaY-like superfamily)
MNPKVDFYFLKAKKWQKELEKLREIALDTQLTEVLKWGCPCYSYQKKNVVLIHDFKDYCAFLFFKGALMKDPKKILIQQTENVQSARQVRFTNLKEITKLEGVLKSYIFQAINVEESGKKVELKKTSDFPVPEEFQDRLKKNTALKKAFYDLTPGRQRAYLFHFNQAKQSKTREARVEKYIPKILKGEGIED